MGAAPDSRFPVSLFGAPPRSPSPARCNALARGFGAGFGSGRDPFLFLWRSASSILEAREDPTAELSPRSRSPRLDAVAFLGSRHALQTVQNPGFSKLQFEQIQSARTAEGTGPAFNADGIAFRLGR